MNSHPKHDNTKTESLLSSETHLNTRMKRYDSVILSTHRQPVMRFSFGIEFNHRSDVSYGEFSGGRAN